MDQFIHISRSPHLRSSPTTHGEKNTVIVHGAPRGRKAYIQWGAAWFPKGIVHDTGPSFTERSNIYQNSRHIKVTLLNERSTANYDSYYRKYSNISSHKSDKHLHWRAEGRHWHVTQCTDMWLSMHWHVTQCTDMWLSMHCMSWCSGIQLFVPTYFNTTVLTSVTRCNKPGWNTTADWLPPLSCCCADHSQLSHVLSFIKIDCFGALCNDTTSLK